MKNFFIPFAIGILIQVNSYAVSGTSRLKVRHIDHQFVRVQLNQGPVSQPTDAIFFDNIRPGTHHIRVWVKNGPRKRDEFVLAFSGPVRIPAHSDVRTILHRNGQLRIFEVIPLNPSPAVTCQPIPIGPCTSPTRFGMEEGAFRHLVSAIDHVAFDQTRLQLARQAISAHGSIRTDQMELLMSRMSFESSRLALAKHGYSFTVDQGNYHRLFHLFHFDSSIRELSAYIYGGGV